MRKRMSAALVALTAAIALSALSAPAWAAKPKPKPVVVSPTKVKAGQKVKVSGGGCRGITVLVFLIDGKEFHRGYAKSGNWTYQVTLPRGLTSGSHSMGAKCRGSSHKPERPAAWARAHPRRQHPRPLSRRASPEPRVERAPEREGSPTPGSGDPVVHNPPPVAAGPAAQVRVPPVAVRVTPPAVLGRSLPEVEVATPKVSATLDEGPRLRPR